VLIIPRAKNFLWRGSERECWAACNGLKLLLLLQLMQLCSPYTVKKRLAIFPSPTGMSLTKLSLAGNNLMILGQGEQFFFYSVVSTMGAEARLITGLLLDLTSYE
jgi:hypothetical protein